MPATGGSPPGGFSSIGTKLLIALTGLVLVLYLVLHLAGNAIVFAGPALFNGYSHRLLSNPLVVPAELGLAAIFLVHIYKTVRMWFASRGARPEPYQKKTWAGPPSRKSIASSTMIASGLITLVFVISHLKTFKYGAHYRVADSELRDLYRLEMEVFSNPYYVALYLAGMIVIGSHLWHGVGSAIESLGFNHPRYTRRLLRMSKVLAIVIAGGFMLIPLWIFFARPGGGR